MQGLESWNQFLKISIYLKACSTSFPGAQSASLCLPTSAQGVLRVSSCSSMWFNPYRGRWQVPTASASLWLTLPFMKCLLFSKDFIYIKSVSCYNKPMRWEVLVCSFYPWENWGRGQLHNLSKVKQLGGGQDRMLRRVAPGCTHLNTLPPTSWL